MQRRQRGREAEERVVRNRVNFETGAAITVYENMTILIPYMAETDNARVNMLAIHRNILPLECKTTRRDD